MAAKKDLWRMSDEMTLLQSVIDFKEEFNKDAATNRDAFFNYVKGKLIYTEFTKPEVMDKLRKLKNNYKNHLKKVASKGPFYIIPIPYEAKCYKLSKQIWGPHPLVLVVEEDHVDVDSAVLEDLNSKSKRVCVAQTDAYLRNLALLEEQKNWIYSQFKSSD